MNLDEIALRRRSVRKYQADKKISKEQIVELLKFAQQAPSWKNSQTGRYYIVFNEEKLKEVRNALLPQNQIVTKDVNTLIVTSFVKNRSGFDKNGTPDNELGNGWGCYDLGLQNAFLLLKAAELGIDSIILGLRDAQQLRNILNIPNTEEIVSVIALGYRAEEEIIAPARKNIEDIAIFY